MKSALDIQALASVLVVGPFIASECAASLLEAHPTSRLAWQLNLGALGAFEHARLTVGAAHLLFSPVSLPLGVTLLLVVLAVRVMRWRFGVALLANLSFMASLVLVHAVACEKLAHRSALTPGALARDAQLPLVVVMLLGSFTGFAVSHGSFIRAIRARAGTATRSTEPRRELAWRSAWQPLTAGRGGSAARPSGAAEYC